MVFVNFFCMIQLAISKCYTQLHFVYIGIYCQEMYFKKECILELQTIHSILELSKIIIRFVLFRIHIQGSDNDTANNVSPRFVIALHTADFYVIWLSFRICHSSHCRISRASVSNKSNWSKYYLRFKSNRLSEWLKRGNVKFLETYFKSKLLFGN